VELAENWLFDQPVEMDEIEQILRPFWEESVPAVDAIVLGCTHFPLIQGLLQKASQPFVNSGLIWQDSGDAIARRVSSILESFPGSMIVHSSDHPLNLSSNHSSELRPHQFLYTGKEIPDSQVASALFRIGLKHFQAKRLTS
jgi:glutamate racemase